MKLQTRPSLAHWIVAVLAVGAITLVLWVPVLFLVAKWVEPERRLVASLVATLIVPLALLPKLRQSSHAATWSVDFEGLESPSIGRIPFSDIISISGGYPRAESVPMSMFQTVLGPELRRVADETLILRLADGRLLPLNLLSPSIVGGAAVMSKLKELLVGKRQPVIFSAAEVAALRSRPTNRLVVPKGGDPK